MTGYNKPNKDDKMKIETKKWLKNDIIDVLLALVVTIMAYLLFTYVSKSVESMLIPVIFILVLILLKVSGKK